MILTILESPYGARQPLTVADHVDYARKCLADSLKHGEAPIASHLLHTQPGVLDDANPTERALGIAAGHAWYYVAQRCVVYEDHGISDGMQEGVERAEFFNVPIVRRSIL